MAMVCENMHQIAPPRVGSIKKGNDTDGPVIYSYEGN